MAAIDLVAHQKHDSLATPAELPFLYKECLEIARAEGFSPDAAALVHVRGTRYELGFLFDVLHRSGRALLVLKERLDEPSRGAGRRGSVWALEAMSGP